MNIHKFVTILTIKDLNFIKARPTKDKIMETDTNLDRRDALKTIAASALLCAGMPQSWLSAKPAYAMGKADIPQGIQKVEGDVTINGIPAKPGDSIAPDDVIVTGKNSSVVFVFGDSASMMRENSRMIVKNADKTAETGKAINALRLLDGGLLSAFGPGDKSVETPSAYIGIRGTGIYVETDNDKTYICTCYGKVTLRRASDPLREELINSKHHDVARYVYSTGHIKKAPMINHTDDELVMLEAFVRRLPPFTGKDGGGGY